jgi:hypothetical protein
MDIVYLFRHSRWGDDEIRFSLRSVARNMPYIRKVWIFGDCPRFISNDRHLIECVPWEAVAWVIRARCPVRNFLLQTALVAMHPEVDFEFLLFTDDYVLLHHTPEALVRQTRYVEDMANVKSRGTGSFKEQLWRTYELLKRLGYGSINYESHMPQYFTKKQVFEAYRDFSDYVTEDRHYGMTGPTAMLNHAYKQKRFPLIHRGEEGLYAGFHGKAPTYDKIVEGCKGKLFLNFDDEGFGIDMFRFLRERFPHPCCFEAPPVRKQEPTSAAPAASVAPKEAPKAKLAAAVPPAPVALPAPIALPTGESMDPGTVVQPEVAVSA